MAHSINVNSCITQCSLITPGFYLHFQNKCETRWRLRPQVALESGAIFIAIWAQKMEEHGMKCRNSLNSDYKHKQAPQNFHQRFYHGGCGPRPGKCLSVEKKSQLMQFGVGGKALEVIWSSLSLLMWETETEEMTWLPQANTMTWWDRGHLLELLKTMIQAVRVTSAWRPRL